jgi:tetratricopeptide (TPR) repeat protein
MEGMVAEDKEIGNIKELGSLYERVGEYEKSADLRRSELEMVRGNPAASLSTLLEIAQLHVQDKDREKALAALGEMEEVMRDLIRRDDAPEFFRAMTFRSYWAMHLARLGQPDRAWQMVRYDATMTKRQLGRIAEPVLMTMVVLYDRMCMQRDSGRLPGGAALLAMEEVRKELNEAFGKGYFRTDDSYNAIINRYFVLGRYAVADAGREGGLERLRRDGPYPGASKDHTLRSRGLNDEDWEWLRITPQLYLAMGMEMLDQDEYPELYDPAGAKPLLEDVRRAVARGTGLGSDVAGGDDRVKAEMTLAFLNNDLPAFRLAMREVKEKNYSSLYDDAAMTFGLNCGLIPLEDFPAWTEAFHEFFPGSQHYFKVVYRAIDKEHYDHALVMAEATARFFPEKRLLSEEEAFVRSIVPGLKERKARRAGRIDAAEEVEAVLEPAA